MQLLFGCLALDRRLITWDGAARSWGRSAGATMQTRTQVILRKGRLMAQRNK